MWRFWKCFQSNCHHPVCVVQGLVPYRNPEFQLWYSTPTLLSCSLFACETSPFLHDKPFFLFLFYPSILLIPCIFTLKPCLYCRLFTPCNGVRYQQLVMYATSGIGLGDDGTVTVVLFAFSHQRRTKGGGGTWGTLLPTFGAWMYW